ncbi:MAG: hypothetical protein K8Q99_06005 [Acholeplasmataceae bacterium]|nr:hypothetical protein [Acholeplasmataceae bacterium]
MYVEVGNFYYFLYFAIAILITTGLILYLKNKDDKVKRKVILFLLFSAFALHFIKLLFYPYNTMFPEIIRKSSFENVCAVSTLVFPFIFLSKSKILKDYMIVAGIFSGFIAYIYPTEAIFDTFDSVYFGMKGAFSFDVIRFYYAHLVIFLAPFLMGYFKLHEFKFKRLIFLPIMIMLMLTTIYLNEVILLNLGWIDPNGFGDVNIRNSSFVFGVSEHYKNAASIFDVFVFDFLKTNPFNGNQQYWPVIWMIVPIFVYSPILALISNIPFFIQNNVSKLRHK